MLYQPSALHCIHVVFCPFTCPLKDELIAQEGGPRLDLQLSAVALGTTNRSRGCGLWLSQNKLKEAKVRGRTVIRRVDLHGVAF